MSWRSRTMPTRAPSGSSIRPARSTCCCRPRARAPTWRSSPARLRTARPIMKGEVLVPRKVFRLLILRSATAAMRVSKDGGRRPSARPRPSRRHASRLLRVRATCRPDLLHQLPVGCPSGTMPCFACSSRIASRRSKSIRPSKSFTGVSELLQPLLQRDPLGRASAAGRPAGQRARERRARPRARSARLR